MDRSLPGSSVHEDALGKNSRVSGHIFLTGTFPAQGSNSSLLHCRRILYHLSQQGSPFFFLCVCGSMLVVGGVPEEIFPFVFCRRKY